MEKREIDLTVSCYGKVKDVKYDVVILPWGLPSLLVLIIPDSVNFLSAYTPATLPSRPFWKIL